MKRDNIHPGGGGADGKSEDRWGEGVHLLHNLSVANISSDDASSQAADVFLGTNWYLMLFVVFHQPNPPCYSANTE